MRLRPRPASQPGASPRVRAAVSSPTRKIFNCIVDESALVAGVKKSTRNGIRQWVKNGQIRLFVPLHALEELSRLKSGKNRHADDVRETLAWLDDATEKYPDFVALQGGDETFQNWAEVERFAVPRTLFSEYDHDDHEIESSDMIEETPTKLALTPGDGRVDMSSEASEVSRSLSPASLDSFRSSISPVSPPMSPPKTINTVRNITLLTPANSRPQSSSGLVPLRMQPLFNYILWRVHQEMDPVAALESFIFLCNDTRKVNFAKGFDIRTKRLEQLREAVSREDREYRNRQALVDKESQTIVPAEIKPEVNRPTSPDEDQDEVVVFKAPPPKAPAAMLSKPQVNVIDPNTFGRGPLPTGPQESSVPTPKSPRAYTQNFRGSPHGSHALPFAPRGGMRGNPRGAFRGNARGRGNFGPAGRGGYVANRDDLSENTAAKSQIDPDSFARPGSMGGGRGARKLWVPT